MVELDPLESKIIKQVEYYFGDINLSRDKFMRQAITENDGWISFDTMLKFNRLKSLSEDVELIKKAIAKSSSGLLESGPNGIRRNPDLELPNSFDEIFPAYKDRSVYVKGFEPTSTLDEIIEWLEKHGGKTLNVHTRRFPDTKKFKGSVFAVFEKKEDAEQFLNCEEAATYKEKSTTRMYREDYLKGKQEEKKTARAEKKAATEASRDEQVTARMSVGALLELSGLPKVVKPTGNTSEKEDATKPEGEEAETTNGDEKEGAETPTIKVLKQWLVEKVGTDNPVAWIDVDPAEGKAIVRFKMANMAEPGLNKLKAVFEDKPIVYSNCELTGRVLSGEEELAHWRTIFAAQQQKAQKRRGGRAPGRGFDNKRRRTH